jgi:hypothetical protein
LPGADYDQVAIRDTSTSRDLTIMSGATLRVNDINALQLNSVAYVPAGPNNSLNNSFVFSLQSGTTNGQFNFLSDGISSVAISYLDGIGTATIDSVLFNISYDGDFSTNAILGGHDVVFSAYAAAVP